MDDLSPTEVEALTKVMGSTVLSEYKQRELNEPTAAAGLQGLTPEMQETSFASRAQFLQLNPTAAAETQAPTFQDLENLQNIKIDAEVILGKTKMPLREVLALHTGSVLALQQLAGEPVDLLANGKVIANAEIVVIDDRFALRILEIMQG